MLGASGIGREVLESARLAGESVGSALVDSAGLCALVDSAGLCGESVGCGLVCSAAGGVLDSELLLAGV